MSVTIRGMGAPDEGATSPDPGPFAAAGAYALDVLFSVRDWTMTEARWLVIADLVGEVEAALSAGDAEALTAAATELELAGPVRLTPIGDIPVVTPPPPVLFRLNRLVFSLGGTTAGPDGAGDDDTSGS